MGNKRRDFSRIASQHYEEVHQHFDEHIESLRECIADEDYPEYMSELVEFNKCLLDFAMGLDGIIEGKSGKQIVVEQFFADMGIEIRVVEEDDDTPNPN
jgi:heme oxygenase